jgi:hypothetical protein
MPARMLPTAPIPVHTAYAVPKGSDRSASAINPKLNAIAITVATVGQNRVSPSEYFRPRAQATSSAPAPSSASHAFTVLSSSWVFPSKPQVGVAAVAGQRARDIVRLPGRFGDLARIRHSLVSPVRGASRLRWLVRKMSVGRRASPAQDDRVFLGSRNKHMTRRAVGHAHWLSQN